MAAKRVILQFQIRLLRIEPPIWRRIQVPANYTIWDLHVAIQDAMGWDDSHLHVFQVSDPRTGEMDRIGIPLEDDLGLGEPDLPEWEIPVRDYLREPGDKAEYEYDFGDGWKHEILLEAILLAAPRIRYPRCLEGERACPPEDCGGPFGYANLLSALTEPDRENDEDLLEWVGPSFDPEAFDPQAVRFSNPKKRWQRAFRGE